ncbi:hypothetical protein CYMTET_33097 [Cymbomonas tetramitiformis]|uniref:RZ-type domain-containing protein n=1 Tax=Cymbomonas tetramitiformis TaxID=36881 RepID=A0AAE0KR80_9CHLO|nr:hypothetical protein CYMTET_33097 [Cymbomonas tetramitiformis]
MRDFMVRRSTLTQYQFDFIPQFHQRRELRLVGMAFVERVGTFLDYALSIAEDGGSATFICQYLTCLYNRIKLCEHQACRNYCAFPYISEKVEAVIRCQQPSAVNALLLTIAWFPGSCVDEAQATARVYFAKRLLELLCISPPVDFLNTDTASRARLNTVVVDLLRRAKAPYWAVAGLPWGLELKSFFSLLSDFQPDPQYEVQYLTVLTSTPSFSLRNLDRSIVWKVLEQLMKTAPTVRAIAALMYDTTWAVDSLSGQHESAVVFRDELDLHIPDSKGNELLSEAVRRCCALSTTAQIGSSLKELPPQQTNLIQHLQMLFMDRLLKPQSSSSGVESVSCDDLVQMLPAMTLQRGQKHSVLTMVARSYPEVYLSLLSRWQAIWTDLSPQVLEAASVAFVDNLVRRARSTPSGSTAVFCNVQAGLGLLQDAAGSMPPALHQQLRSEICSQLQSSCKQLLPLRGLLRAARQLGYDPNFYTNPEAQELLLSNMRASLPRHLGNRSVTTALSVMSQLCEVSQESRKCCVPNEIAAKTFCMAIDFIFKDQLCLHPTSSALVDVLCHTNSFWLIVLRATQGRHLRATRSDLPTPMGAFAGHRLVIRLVAQLDDFASGITNLTWTVAEARVLLEVPAHVLQEYLEATTRPAPSSASSASTPKEMTSDVLAQCSRLRTAIHSIEQSFSYLQAFLLNCCEDRAVDWSECASWLASLQGSFSASPLSAIEVGGDDSVDANAYWGPQLPEVVRQAARQVYHLRDSVLFQGVWHRLVDDASGKESATVDDASGKESATNMVPLALMQMQEIAERMVRGPEFSIQEILTIFGTLQITEREFELVLPEGAHAAAASGHLQVLKGDLQWVARQQELHTKAQCLEMLLEMFDVYTYADVAHREPPLERADRQSLRLATLASTVRGLQECFADKELSVSKLRRSSEALDRLLREFSAVMPMVEVLGAQHGDTFVQFLRRATYHEFRVALLDSAEEGSATFLGEDVVSDLLKCKLFLDPLLTPDFQAELHAAGDPGQLLLRRLSTRMAEQGDCIPSCVSCVSHVHALERMYNGMANREVLTRDVIQAIMRCGSFRFQVDGIRCQYWAETAGVGEKEVEAEMRYDAGSLSSLRSRALLFNNKDLLEVMSAFCHTVNRAAAVSDCISSLCSLGHLDYRSTDKAVPPAKELEELEARVLGDLVAWEHSLKAAWSEHYLLSFFAGSQLWQLHDWMHAQSSDGVVAASREQQAERMVVSRGQDLLRTLHPAIFDSAAGGIGVQEALSNHVAPAGGAHEKLMGIGAALHAILHGVEPSAPRAFGAAAADVPGAAALQPRRLVKPGQLFVARTDGHEVLAMVMELFRSEGAFPERSQLLFCQGTTPWEELQAFLHRAFFADQCELTTGKLFVIAGCEALGEAAQLELVRGVRWLVHQQGHSALFRLALLCNSSKAGCGTTVQQLLDEFSACIQELSPLLEQEMQHCLKRVPQREVLVVTSDRPGLGKTETIRGLAAQQGRPLITLPVYDGMTRDAMIQRLVACLDEYRDGLDCSLHIIVTPVKDAEAMSIMLFELLVVGSLQGDIASRGATLAHMHCSHVFLEVANTPLGDLQRRVKICDYFHRNHLEFDRARLLLSSEITSDVQIVCNYLRLLEEGHVDGTMLSFGEFGACEGLATQRSAQALPPEDCCRLLSEQFLDALEEPSFNLLNTFTAVLANQLRIFTVSDFFNTEVMCELFADYPAFRSLVLTSLVETARVFASRSVGATKRLQHTSVIGDQEAHEAEALTSRLAQMLSWESSNHLMVILQPSGGVAALYRELAHVPAHIRQLYESQMCPTRYRQAASLPDYRTMRSEELLEELAKLVRRSGSSEGLAGLSYAVTADNLLKMAVIHLRLMAGVPVLLMGETGCGKTSLVRFLAHVSDMPEDCFVVLNVHAGVTQEELVHYVRKCESLSEMKGRPVWAFLDECNTCGHMALVNELVCHRSLLGRPLHRHVTVIAACNPYRKRNPLKLPPSAGFNSKLRPDSMSSLVYRVNPLPETMLDYVWDFGNLSAQDERRYVSRILANAVESDLLVEAAIMSHGFVREVEEMCSVSLRDICRLKLLAAWFLDKLSAREECARKERREHQARADGSYFSGVSRYLYYMRSRDHHHRTKGGPSASKAVTEQQLRHRAIVLALLHCYYCRLATAEHRQAYLQRLAGVLQTAGHKHMDARWIRQEMRAEQLEWVNRMELPEGTARNEALLENVFVLLVCVLNRLPVFLVGKPGCSKSLAFQLINSSLRGADSKDPFLKTLPQLYVLSYQGSEDSKSEGIERVFDRAKRYAEKNDGNVVLPVVLLDEVGLAEVSPHNPLKVLHSLLEVEAEEQFRPGTGAALSYAAVGISNWALDAAKMNRAVWISRPDPGLEDLELTAEAIVESINGSARQTGELRELLHSLAATYHAFQVVQRGATEGSRNFHGLRDFYSLIKCVAAHVQAGGCAADEQAVTHAIARNFGGAPESVQHFLELFLAFLAQRGWCWRASASSGGLPPLSALVCENLADASARHLMLLTRGDSAISVLHAFCSKDPGTGRQLLVHPVCMVGSQFADDQVEEHSFECLQQVILCMETGRQLILIGHERIYGALYDMLNQHYVVVNGRRHCRVALGADSNPMCRVHEDFRCVVLVDERRVDYSDPPFLNRFEKQLLRFGDIVRSSPAQQEALEALEAWVQQAACIFPDDAAGRQADFDARDAFCGYHHDTLPSLVLLHRAARQDRDGRRGDADRHVDADVEEILTACKRTLMTTASADAVARLQLSALALDRREETADLIAGYRQDLRHVSLVECWKYQHQCVAANHRPVEPGDNDDEGDDRGGQASAKQVSNTGRSESRGSGRQRLLIMTYSPLTTCPRSTLGDVCSCKVLNLGKFASERMLSSEIEHFWSEDCEEELLVVQCDAVLHAKHLPLCRHKMEDAENEYQQTHLAPDDLAEAAQPPPASQDGDAEVSTEAAPSRAAAADGGSRGSARRRVPKSQMIVVHMRRSTFEGEEDDSWQLNLLVDWEQVMVDKLDGDVGDVELLRAAHEGSLTSLLSSGGLSAERLVHSELPWSLQCMKFPEADDRMVLTHVRRSLDTLRGSPELMRELAERVVRHIAYGEVRTARREDQRHEADGGSSWVARLACSRQQLAENGTLAGAVRNHARLRVRQPLAKLMYTLERQSALASLNACLGGESPAPEDFALWRSLFLTDAALDISGVVGAASGPECFALAEHHPHVRWPLSTIIASAVEASRGVFMELCAEGRGGCAREGASRQGEQAWSAAREESFLRGLPGRVLQLRPTLCQVIKKSAQSGAGRSTESGAFRRDGDDQAVTSGERQVDAACGEIDGSVELTIGRQRTGLSGMDGMPQNADQRLPPPEGEKESGPQPMSDSEMKVGAHDYLASEAESALNQPSSQPGARHGLQGWSGRAGLVAGAPTARAAAWRLTGLAGVLELGWTACTQLHGYILRQLLGRLCAAAAVNEHPQTGLVPFTENGLAHPDTPSRASPAELPAMLSAAALVTCAAALFAALSIRAFGRAKLEDLRHQPAPQLHAGAVVLELMAVHVDQRRTGQFGLIYLVVKTCLLLQPHLVSAAVCLFVFYVLLLYRHPGRAGTLRACLCREWTDHICMGAAAWAPLWQLVTQSARAPQTARASLERAASAPYDECASSAAGPSLGEAGVELVHGQPGSGGGARRGEDDAAKARALESLESSHGVAADVVEDFARMLWQHRERYFEDFVGIAADRMNRADWSAQQQANTVQVLQLALSVPAFGSRQASEPLSVHTHLWKLQTQKLQLTAGLLFDRHVAEAAAEAAAQGAASWGDQAARIVSAACAHLCHALRGIQITDSCHRQPSSGMSSSGHELGDNEEATRQDARAGDGEDRATKLALTAWQRQAALCAGCSRELRSAMPDEYLEPTSMQLLHMCMDVVSSLVLPFQIGGELVAYITAATSVSDMGAAAACRSDSSPQKSPGSVLEVLGSMRQQARVRHATEVTCAIDDYLCVLLRRLLSEDDDGMIRVIAGAECVNEELKFSVVCAMAFSEGRASAGTAPLAGSGDEIDGSQCAALPRFKSWPWDPSRLPPMMAQVYQGILLDDVEDGEDVASRFWNNDLPGLMDFELLSAALQDHHVSDSWCAALACDVLHASFAERLAGQGQHSAGGNLSDLQPTFKRALASMAEDGAALDAVCGAAFAKAYIDTLAKPIIQAYLTPCSAPVADSSRRAADEAFGVCNAVLGDCAPSALQQGLRVYLLKGLRESSSLQQLKQECKAGRLSRAMPWLEQLPWELSVESQLGFNPFALCEGYAASKSAIEEAFRGGGEGLCSRAPAELRGALVGSDGGRALLLSVASTAYLARTAQDQDWALMSRRMGSLVSSLRGSSEGEASDTSGVLVTNWLGCLACNEFGEGGSSLQMTQGSGLTDVVLASLLVQLTGVLLNAADEATASPFALYFQDPEAAASDFVIAMPSDEFLGILRALHAAGSGGVSRYQCSCGYMYTVGECGQTDESGVCPSCSSVIGNAHGGSTHVPAPRQRRLDAGLVHTADEVADTCGYVAVPATQMVSATHSERGLPPAAFRVMHLLTHLALAAGSIARRAPPSDGEPTGTMRAGGQDDEALARFMGKAASREGALPERQATSCGALRECLAAVKSDLAALCELLPGCSAEGVCALLHAVILRLPDSLGQGCDRLRSAAARAQWENAFAASYLDALSTSGQPAASADPATTSREWLARFTGFNTTAAAENLAFDALVEEHHAELHHEAGTQGPHRPTIGSCSADKQHAPTLYKPRLLRRIQPPSLQSLHAALLSTEGGAPAQYPFLDLFLRLRSELELLQHLPPLLEWTRLIQHTWARRLTREEARSKDAHWLLERHRGVFDEDLAGAFRAFARAWNAAAPLVRSFECAGNISMPTIDESGHGAALSLCLVDRRDDGVLVRLAVEALAGIQNRFLESVIPLIRQCPRLQHLALGGGAIAMPKLPLRELPVEAVISCDVDRTITELLAFSHSDLEYGSGRSTKYSFAHMERQLARRVLDGVALIELNPNCALPLFHFEGEAFLEHFTLMDDVAETLPQAPLLPSRDVIHQDFEKLGAVTTARSLTSCLESCCFYLLRTHSLPHEPLKEYCEMWVPELAAEVPFDRPSLRELQLQHVQQLYEVAEDILASITVEDIQDVFCEPLPKSIKDQVATTDGISIFCSALQGGVTSLEKGLKRFIHRFLVSEKAPLPPEQPLRDYLELLSLKGVDPLELRDHFPAEIQLAHTYRLWENTVQRIEIERRASTGVGTSAAHGDVAAVGQLRAQGAQRQGPPPAYSASGELHTVRRQTRRKKRSTLLD